MHPAFTLPAWADPWPGKGIIYDLPEHQYHDTKALVSKSALDLFSRSPAHYRHSLDAPPELPTDEMRVGNAFHVLTLEPDLYRSKVAVLPDFGSMHSSTNRKLRDAWIDDEGRGRVILSRYEHDLITAMANSVRAHPAARRLLSRGDAEVTALWTDPETGLRCKARGDWVSAMSGVFVDLKSCINASPDAFARAAATHRYHVQDAKYTRAFDENGITIEHFAFIAVEKEPPHVTAVYQLDDTARLKGEELYMAELRGLRHCIDTDHWPGYSDRVMDLSLPAWSTRTEST